jgi:pimeloyl-ACP methyl ester carboxylesterase
MGCDHTIFCGTSRILQPLYRVVSVDLRGHGRSDAPHQDYTMAGPQLVTAQTLGSGHLSPLFVPDQINAMLSTFLRFTHPEGMVVNGLIVDGLSGSSFDALTLQARIKKLSSSPVKSTFRYVPMSSQEIFGDRASGSMLCRLIRNGPVTWL